MRDITMKTLGGRLLILSSYLCLGLQPGLLRGEVVKPDDIISTADERQALSINVFQSGIAQVWEQRTLTDAKFAVTRIKIRDLSPQMFPESLQVRGSFKVRERSFELERLTPESLLNASIGTGIGLVRTHPQTGDEKLEQGKVLGVSGDRVVLEVGGRIELSGVHSPWRFVFDRLPEGLQERPTLTLSIEPASLSEQALELGYLTSGLSWAADYTAYLDAAGESMDLDGWMTLSNTTGVSFSEAELQVVAGEPNRASGGPPMARAAVAMDQAFSAPAPEAAFEYHRYRVSDTVALADKQTKQLLLMQARKVPVTTEYRVDASGSWHGSMDGEQQLSVDAVLRLHNAAPALGEPMPGGLVRFYQAQPAQGGTETLGERSGLFIGEASLPHLPVGKESVLRLGGVFDVTATRRQTEFGRKYGDERESAWLVTLRNAKPKAVEVAVSAQISGTWSIVEESHQHEKLGAHLVRWRVEVPPGGQSELNYRVRIR